MTNHGATRVVIGDAAATAVVESPEGAGASAVHAAVAGAVPGHSEAQEGRSADRAGHSDRTRWAGCAARGSAVGVRVSAGATFVPQSST
jgi:hypothetical protein